MRAKREVRAGLRGRTGGARAGSILIFAAFAGVLAATPVAGDYTLYVLALVVVEGIAVLSLNLLMGYAGQVSLGQAALVGVGAFATGELLRADVPYLLALPGAIIVTAVASTIVGLPSLRIRGLQVAATTLAFGLVAERVLFARPWDTTAGSGIAVPRPTALIGGRAFLFVALAGLGAVLLFDRALRRSRTGRALFAVRDREDTAAARGIAVGPTKLTAYALSGAYAGLAGALFGALVERATADSFTVFTSLGLVAAVVVGGLGSWTGALAAGVVFAGLPELLRPVAGYAPLAGAALLAIVPVARPEGLGWLLNRRLPIRLGPRERRRTFDAFEAEERLAGHTRSLALSMPVRTLLHARDIGVAFGGLRALDGVSMEVRRGEIVGLIGPNGAGKSTFFNCLSGFVTPDAGSITYRGRDLLALPPYARPRLGIARTFQQVGLSTRLSARDNAILAQHEQATYSFLSGILRTPRARAIERDLAERADAALTVVGLDDRADVTVGNLSQGDQRLAEVAAALATGPELLLLDEPFAGTGPEESEALAERLRDLRGRLGLTIVVIEHDVPLVASLSDHVYVFDQGAVLAEGAPHHVQRDPAVVAIYLGEPVTSREVANA